MHLSPAFNNPVISEECVLLYDQNKSLNLDLPYDQYSRFKLDYMENYECLAEFGARKPDIRLLEGALQIPEEFQAETEKRVRGERRAYARS